MKLFIGDSCMLYFFYTYASKNTDIIKEIYYTYPKGTSTCIFDEVNNPNSELYKREFDVYMIGMGDVLRQELYYSSTRGANSKDINFDKIIDSLIERLIFSINKIREFTNNPIFLTGYVIDIYKNKLFSYKYKENPIKYHFRYMSMLYDIAEKMDNVFVFDLNKSIGRRGYPSNMYRFELHGSHTEVDCGKPLYDSFIENLKGIESTNKILEKY
jgi:hypothetical protein